MNVLAIGAHGDDLEMFCGGTLARYAQNGHQVFMCVVTDGRGRPRGDEATIIRVRTAEAEASAAVIGAEPVWMGIPDGGLLYSEETRHQFVEVIRRTQPDVIITHPPEDYHPDHRVTNQLVKDAVQLARTRNFPTDLEPHRVTLPVYYMESERGIGFLPEEYVDISGVWQTKLEMLAQHRSQLMPEDYDPAFEMPPPEENVFNQYATALGAFRGLACNVSYAEGFRQWYAANRLVTRRLLP